MTPFFVTGFPRSRTAWCANWLTTGESLCFHEPKETVEELISQYPQYRLGVSNSMLVPQFFALSRQYPKAPWVYIDRDKSAVEKSMLAFAGTHLTAAEYQSVIRTHFAAAQIVKDHSKTLVVSFEDLDKKLPEVWSHLLPDLTFNAIRSHLLSEFKVEQRLEAALNRFQNGREILWQSPS